MRVLCSLFLSLALPALASAAGRDITYSVDGKPYEGYFVPADNSKGLVLLMHDWDGLTGYDKQRADMLAAEGYSVFAVFGTDRYREGADKQSWRSFRDFLARVL